LSIKETLTLSVSNMNYSKIILCCLALEGVAAFAPQNKLSVTKPSSSLEATKFEDINWGTAFTSAVVGLTFAARASFASVEAPREAFVPNAAFIQQTTTTIAAATAETMDFSLPSYSDAVKDSVKNNGKAAPPSFNPFGEEAPKVEKAAEPKVEAPKVEMPKLEVPKVDFPKFEMPKKAEKAAEVEAPKGEMPKFDMPKVGIPTMPKIDMPKFSAPKFDMPKSEYDMDMPKIDVPKVNIPKVNIPKVDLPPLSNPFASSAPDSGVPLQSRDIRDEKARQSRDKFLEADQDVKEAEGVLKALKEVSTAKKQSAAEAKDLACADRPGGKYICLRNPFTVGF